MKHSKFLEIINKNQECFILAQKGTASVIGIFTEARFSKKEILNEKI